MKKITLLIALLTLPFLGFSQLKDYTFNTEGDKEGWTGAGLDLSATPNPTGGFLIATGKGSAAGYPQMRSEVYAPLLAVASNQKIVVTIVAENATDNEVWQIGNLDEGSTNFGAAVFAEFSMPIVAPGSGTSTFEVEVPINPDNTNGGIERFSIRAKVGSSPGVTGTIKFDRITVNLISTITENSFVSNPDFENGSDPLTDWSASGPDISLGTTSGNGGVNAAQINIEVADTGAGMHQSNNVLKNVVYDFGKTVDPTDLIASFDAMTNSTNSISVQLTARTYDASDNVVETLNSGASTLTNSWQTYNFTKSFTLPFNKILFRIRVKGSPADSGDKVAIDNVAAEFSYYTLGIKDKKVSSNSFKLYPNPANNIINIKSLSAIEKVSIYDVTGKQVLQSNRIIDNKMNVSNLKTGIYLVKLQDVNKNFSTKRIIISR